MSILYFTLLECYPQYSILTEYQNLNTLPTSDTEFGIDSALKNKKGATKEKENGC